MSFWDKLQKGLSEGLKVANDMALKYQAELDKERSRVINMSDESLKYRAVYGDTMAQRVAAKEEWKKRHPETE